MKFYYFCKPLFAAAVCIFATCKAEDWRETQFSITQHNKCIVSNKLNIITTFSRISVQECVSECGNRHDCQAVNYSRRVQICELINSENGILVKTNGKTGPCVLVVKADIKELTSCSCAVGEVCEENLCSTKALPFEIKLTIPHIQLDDETECKSTALENAETVGNINTIGSQILYNCDSGYVNSGHGNATCLSLGTWSNQPHCVADCGTPATVSGASRSFASTTENSLVTYTCLTGYIHTGGDLQLVCGSNGLWGGVLPTCLIDCGTPVAVSGASRSFTSTTETSIGAYTCLTGYTQTGGDLQLVCGSSGQWSGILPTCSIDCGTPSTVSGACRSFTSTTENSLVTYTCQTGYIHTGGDLQLVCGSNGLWGGVLPTCLIDCGTPDTVSGASRSFTSTTETSLVTYTCLTGYTQTGGDLQLVCGSSGQWSGVLPTCSIDCGTPAIVSDTSRSFTSTTETSLVTYACLTGFIHTGGDLQLVCDSNGVWNGVLPTCTISCLEPPNVPNSDVSSGGMTVGAERTYTCISGNYFATGMSVMHTTCQSDGQWSNMNIICPRDSAEQECPGCGLLRDCGDVQSLGLKQTGSYLIYPSGNVGINVRCDMDTSTGGWTIIQRRISNSDFYKTWTEYKNGFGTVDGNYWLGNDNIATLTSLGNYKIRFDLYDQNNVHRYAEYSTFSMADGSQNYRLHVGVYSGNAGDSLSVHNGKMFTTKDVDNDIAPNTNCANLYTGAWWYADCHDSNLNGVYGSSVHGKGVIWYTVTGTTQSLSVTEIKIKLK